MSANLIDGKTLANKVKESLQNDIKRLGNDRGIVPGLTVILVGNDPASQIYVRNKERACKEVGIRSNVVYMEENIHQDDLLREIYRYNQDSDTHGILVQLPLPDHIDEGTIINAIDPRKDVDGFHPITMGSLFVGGDGFEPCTPKGIIALIKETGEKLLVNMLWL